MHVPMVKTTKMSGSPIRKGAATLKKENSTICLLLNHSFTNLRWAPVAKNVAEGSEDREIGGGIPGDGDGEVRSIW